ncbi:OpgC domain-containing protein [Thetidibacter halocola]|uniref:OpgC domain-containing protein n=1 Tax=Thetidibacter halocola TaxID=2827239 RepID=A0A8J7WCH8_9RHOB|nr:OpgC domain-containing protein [Thetidibacter halocola]
MSDAQADSQERPKAPAHLPLVDGIRGYLIFAMTVGHVVAITGVGALSFLTHKPFAVFLTGEGFMAVSGFMTGYILSFRLARRGVLSSLGWGLQRAGRIVAHYIVVFALCLLPALVLPLAGSTASVLLHGRESIGLDDIALFLTGFYRPAFFDILYLYVVYIAIAPVFVLMFQSRLRHVALGLSVLAWLFARYGFTQRAFEALFAQVPGARIEEGGSFHIFAWQMIFFFGVALGALYARDAEALRGFVRNTPPGVLRLMLTLLAVFGVVGLLSASGLAPLGLRYLRDYLTVALLPLMNFVLAVFVLACLLMTPRLANSRVARAVRGLFGLRVLRTIGAVTLQSFSASIVISYWIAYTVPAGSESTPAFALGLLGLCMAVVYGVSVLVNRHQSARKAARRRDGGRGDVPA